MKLNKLNTGLHFPVAFISISLSLWISQAPEFPSFNSLRNLENMRLVRVLALKEVSLYCPPPQMLNEDLIQTVLWS